MAEVELIMPKMGESITEATILKWLKKEGDTVTVDEPVLEIATDKVDSEVPSPFAGVISKILFKTGEVIAVNKPIAIISTGMATGSTPVAGNMPKTTAAELTPKVEVVSQPKTPPLPAPTKQSTTGRFYSPLVLNIARNEGISMTELENVPGTGLDSRITKKDIIAYLENRKNQKTAVSQITENTPPPSLPAAEPVIAMGGNVEIIEMDRMRKLIADHMVMSKRTSAHVTSFVEADVTAMVMWRDRVKKDFEKRENEKLTFTPLFIEVVVKALKDFPWVNASVSGSQIIRRKDINIGMATALPSGNLIVPVIKNADTKNLVGITREVNDLAGRARNGQLKPSEIEGGTFTLTNVGTFGNLMGTPIINQPQVAILATGSIKKKPAVIETPLGDVIAIRQMMFLSLSYDHRIVDGALGGSFLRRVADYLEKFNPERSF